MYWCVYQSIKSVGVHFKKLTIYPPIRHPNKLIYPQHFYNATEDFNVSVTREKKNDNTATHE